MIEAAIELTPEHPPDRLVEYGERVESNGFDGAFVSSHYFNRDPFAVLTALAMRTETIRLGPGIVNPYETHPASLASRLATLAEMSDGRAVCGLGAGDRSTLASLGIERRRPLRRVLESMQVTRKLLEGVSVSHDGTFTVENAKLHVPTCSVPMFVGAQGPEMLRMSGKHADGVLINASHPTDLEWASARVKEGISRRDDDPSSFTTLAWTAMSVATEAHAAYEAARPPVAFIVGDVSTAVLDRHDIDHERAGQIASAIEGGEFSTAFDLVTRDMIDTFAIAGTPTDVSTRLDAIGTHVDGIVAGSPLGPSIPAAIDLLGSIMLE